MRKFTFYAVILLFLLNACNEESRNNSTNKQTKISVLRINESEKFKTLYPPATNDLVSSQIIAQIFEGLVKYEPRTLSIVPAIAEKWKIEDEGMKYTFYLRKNAFFHDNECFENGKGRNITATDVKYSFELLCTKADNNLNFYGTLDKIKGAKEFYEQNDTNVVETIEGIKIIDDYTIELYLESGNPLFIYFLANPAAVILPREGIEKYGENNYVGSGPFRIKPFNKKDEYLTLIKNTLYYKTGKDSMPLPYIDTVKISFFGSVQKELNMFTNNELDIVAGLPSKYIPDFLEQHIDEFESNPPKYILNQSEEDVASEVYNLTHSYVHDFFTNRMNFIDLSLVYFKEPEPVKKDTVKRQM